MITQSDQEITTKQAASMLGVTASYIYNQHYLYSKKRINHVYLLPTCRKGRTNYYSIDSIKVAKQKMKKAFDVKDKNISIQLNGEDIYDKDGHLVAVYSGSSTINEINKLIYKMPLNNALPRVRQEFDVIIKMYNTHYKATMKVWRIQIEPSFSIITLI